MPHSSVDRYIEFLCKEHLTEVLLSFSEDRHTFSILNFEKLFSNIPLYSNSTPNKIDIRFILEVFCTNLIELCKFFNFSLRKQEQLVSLIKIFISSLNPQTDYLFPELICYLVSIRMFNYEYLKYENLLEILTTDPFVSEDQKRKRQNSSIYTIYEKSERKFPLLKNKSIKGDAVDFWIAILKEEELKFEIKDSVLAKFIDSPSFSKIKNDAKKYLLLTKQLTILTTEN